MVEHHCDPRHRRRRDEATAPQHPARLGQRLRSIGRVGQVVQRAEEQHGIDAAVAGMEFAGVALLRGQAACASPFDVVRDDVDDLDIVTVAYEPLLVDAVGAAHVEDP